MKKWTEFRLWFTLGYVIELNEVIVPMATSEVHFIWLCLRIHPRSFHRMSKNLMKCFNDIDFDEKLILMLWKFTWIFSYFCCYGVWCCSPPSFCEGFVKIINFVYFPRVLGVLLLLARTTTICVTGSPNVGTK